MKYAIVEAGGKQYKAVEGSAIEVDLMPVEVGQPVILDKVLLVVDGDVVSIGAPTLAKAKVTAKVESHIKAKKIVVFKYSPKKRIRTKTGHRQQYTRLHIETIEVE